MSKAGLLVVALGVLVIALPASSAVAAETGHRVAGTSATCKDGGWKSLYRQDASTFKTEGACVSYAARGGQLASFDAAVSSDCIGGVPDLACISVVFSGFGLLPAGWWSASTGPDLSLGQLVASDGTVSEPNYHQSGCPVDGPTQIISTATTAEGATITLTAPTPWCAGA